MSYPVGTRLQVTPGVTSGGVEPLVTTYQWELGGTPIPGATAADYTTIAAGLLTCVQTVTDSDLVAITAEAVGVTIVSNDITAPTITAFSPLDNATNVSRTANLVMTFSENIFVGGIGTITLVKLGIMSETAWNLDDPAVTIAGNVLTVVTGVTMDAEADYCVTFNGVLEDAAGNPFATFIDTETWNFTTAAVAVAGASITADFVKSNTLDYLIEWSLAGVWSKIAEHLMENPEPADTYEITGLEFNALYTIRVTADDGVSTSTATWDVWTAPETAPTLTLDLLNVTENTIPFTISGTAPASEEMGSGWEVEISDAVDGPWDTIPKILIPWDADPKTGEFDGLTGDMPYWIRVRTINIQPNTVNDPSYSAHDTKSASTIADENVPTLDSASIDGDQLTLGFSEAVSFLAGDYDDFGIEASTAGTLTISSVTGSGTNTIVATLSAAVVNGETVELTYTQPGNGVEDLAGNDLASISTPLSVTNATAPAVAGPADYSPAQWLSTTGADTGTWSDISGNGYHATQSDAGKKPAIVANQINGYQARRFDGSDDFLSHGLSITSSDNVIFVVISALHPHAGASVIASYAETGTTLKAFATSANSGLGRPGTYRSGFIFRSVYVEDAGWKVFALKTEVAGSTLILDGVYEYIADSAFYAGDAIDRRAIGSSGTGGTGAEYTGDIAEIITYDHSMTDGEINNVLNWLETKFGITQAEYP